MLVLLGTKRKKVFKIASASLNPVNQLQLPILRHRPLLLVLPRAPTPTGVLSKRQNFAHLKQFLLVCKVTRVLPRLILRSVA